jgi:hypothetical protein
MNVFPTFLSPPLVIGAAFFTVRLMPFLEVTRQNPGRAADPREPPTRLSRPRGVPFDLKVGFHHPDPAVNKIETGAICALGWTKCSR